MVARYLIPVVDSTNHQYKLNCVEWVVAQRWKQISKKKVMCCYACHTDITHSLWPHRLINTKMQTVCCSIGNVCLL